LYSGNSLQPDGLITVDNQLNVVTTFAPNPRARFHMWFGLCYNWSMLNPDALIRLMANYDILIRLIAALWPKLPLSRYPKPIGNSNQTSRSSMNDFLNSKQSILAQTDFNTVETFYIQAVENT
jgi:hypothetical protein